MVKKKVKKKISIYIDMNHRKIVNSHIWEGGIVGVFAINKLATLFSILLIN